MAKKVADEELISAYRKAGSITGAARLAGLDRKTVRVRLRRLGALREDGPDPASRSGRKELNLRNEVKHLKRENRRLSSLLLDQENLVERIVAEASAPLPEPNFRVKLSTGKRPRDMILPLFDMQFGQRVRPEDTPGGCGRFDSEVFKTRFDRYIQAVGNNTVDYAHSHCVENVAFVFGGDMVEGDGQVFRGQEWQLEMDAAEQVVRLKDILAAGLHELIGLFKEEVGVKRISIFWIPGNHGKAGGKRSGATPSTLSYDYLLGRWMQDVLKNYPVDSFVVEPAGEVLFESRGWVFRVIHGDEVRGWGGIPFYGLTRMDAGAVRLHNIVFDYLLLGHHHRAASIPIGSAEHLMSGDWVGHNNMARTGSVPLGRPSQWQYFVADEYGVCDRSLIQLTRPEEIARPDVHALA